MADEAQLQINEVVELAFQSLTCTVRCLAGTARVGDRVHLVAPAADRPVATGLTISGIQLVAGAPAAFVDQGRTALVTVTGAIDVAAVRAATAGTAPAEVCRLDLRMVAR